MAPVPPRQIGSNRPGKHPSANLRPVNLPEWNEPTETGYATGTNLVGEPAEQQSIFRIIVIGAGAAGIDFLHHALERLAHRKVDIKCFEKNPDIGGTWYENRYPGCACDGPSPSYQFYWRPNPEWSKYYSEAPEIWEYMKGIVLDERLDRYIEVNTKVEQAKWDDAESMWRVSLSKTDGSQMWEEQCHVLLNGTGFVK